MKRFLSVVKLALVGLFVMAGVVAFSQTDAHAANDINKITLSLIKGESARLTITNPKTTVKWSSSNKTVATVSSKGLVKAKKKGKAYIYATIGKTKKKCFVRVNNTLSVDNSELTISEPTTINIRFKANGTVKKTNSSVVDVVWGSWSGDYLSVNLVPLKKGNEVLKFTNSSNSEIAVVRVHIKEIKPQLVFTQPKVTSGASTFIVGENRVGLSFTPTQNVQDAYINIYDSNKNVVTAITCGALTMNEEKTVEWDGMSSDGNKCDGKYSYGVFCDGTAYTSPYFIEARSVSPFGTGDGSKSNPYRVSSVAEFAMIKQYNGANFVLDSDIDFKNGRFDAPSYSTAMFTSDEPFSGTLEGMLDGKQYSILNLEGKNSLFGYIGESGVLRDLKLVSCVTIANYECSALAYINRGTISNVSISGSLLGSREGAMIVDNNYGVIENCSVDGQIKLNYTATTSGSISMMGGGIAIYNFGRISECESQVNITAHAYLDKNGCYEINDIYEQYLGCIAAANNDEGVISKCVNKGSIVGLYKIPSDYKAVDMSLLENGNEKAKYTVANMFCYKGYLAGRNAGMIVKPTNKNTSLKCGVAGYDIGIVQTE